MKLPIHKFPSEAALVEAFCADLAASRVGSDWTVYHETGGFDLLLVQAKTGIQLGIEAKLSMNVKVLTQAIPASRYHQDEGPDYRGVLVPFGGVQHGLTDLAERLGIGVITFRMLDRYSRPYYLLPDENGHWQQRWHPWLPTRRCVLPDYIPDVTGGKAAPIQLTAWKIKAIKILVLLEKRGFVTRADFKVIGIDAQRWAAPGGYLVPKDGAYVAGDHTPSFKAHHPKNWAEIEASFATWAPPPSGVQQTLMAIPEKAP